MFRELTDAELALLSDSEKEVYNKELLLYKESRVLIISIESQSSVVLTQFPKLMSHNVILSLQRKFLFHRDY